MEKLPKLYVLNTGIKLIGWDLDGTLFDTESVWYRMHDLVIQKYGHNLGEEEINKAQEDIAEQMYRTVSYRANADMALKYFKELGIHQSLVNYCALTNKTMMQNPNVLSQFGFDKFDSIISSENFSVEVGKKEMYLAAMEMAKISDPVKAVGIEDLPDGLEGAKKAGMITIWARNPDYPFSKEELSDIKGLADFYVDDFSELVR